MKRIASLFVAAMASFVAVNASAQTVATTATAADQLTDGYYVIKAKAKGVSGYVSHRASNNGNRPYGYSSAETVDATDLTYVWYLKKMGDNTFTLQNASTGGFYCAHDGNASNLTDATTIDNAAILGYKTFEAIDGSLENGVILYEDNYVNKVNIHVNGPTSVWATYTLGYWSGGTVTANGSLGHFAFYSVSGVTPTVEPTKDSYALTYALKDGETTIANVGSVKTASELTGTAELPSSLSSSLTVSYYYTLQCTSENTEISTTNHNFTYTPTKGEVPFTLSTDDSKTWYNVYFGDSQANYLVLSGSTIWANQSKPSTYDGIAKNGAWAIEESGYGVKIKNRSTGTYITEADGNNQTVATLSETGTTFIVLQNSNGYSLTVPGYSTNGVGNHVSGKLGVWNNANATTGANSRWNFAQVDIDNAKSYLTTEVNAYNTTASTDEDIYTITYNADEVSAAQTALTSATTLDQLDAAMDNIKTTPATPDASAYYQIYVADAQRTKGYISSSTIDVNTSGTLEAGNNRVIGRTTASDALVPQLWQFEANGDGTYKIRNANTGCCIGQAVTSGTGIEMPIADGGAGTFTIQAGNGDNKSTKVMLLESGKIINAYGGDNNTIISEYAQADDGGAQWTVKKVKSIPVTISESAGWASVALPFAVQKPTDEGVSVYYASSVENSIVHLEEITADIIPAGTGFLLAKDGGATVNLTITTEAGTAPEGNHLVGATAKRSGFTADDTYVLALNSAGKPAFLQSELTSVPANKAYLLTSDVASSEASTRVLNFDLTTGISTATTDAATSAGTYYDLHGRRVLYPTKGIYVNSRGQKVLIK